jgi:hypothetical protein
VRGARNQSSDWTSSTFSLHFVLSPSTSSPGGHQSAFRCRQTPTRVISVATKLGSSSIRRWRTSVCFGSKSFPDNPIQEILLGLDVP